MRILKQALILLVNIILGIFALSSFVLIGLEAGFSGILLYGFVLVVWSQCVFDRKGKPTLLTDLLQSSMVLAWTYLNGLACGSFVVCFFDYVAALCVLCAVRTMESHD